jgi:hypothetical protein
MKFLSIPVLVCLLTSCVSNRPQLKESSEPDAAIFTIRTMARNHVNIHVVSYTGEEYLQSKGEVITLLNSRAIGYDFSDSKTIRVKPAMPFRFSILTGGHEFVGADKLRSSACMTHTSFVPSPKGVYVAVHELVPTGCTVKIMREVDGKLLDEPTAKGLPACLDPSLGGAKFANACKEGFTFR